MKRLIIILLVLIPLTSGCAGSQREEPDKINIVATVFPQYDWLRQIIGQEKMSRFNLTLLLDNNIDLHNYQPSVADIITISGCDLFIYVGGHSDGWADDVLRQAVNPDMKVINLMEALGDRVITDYHDHDHDECEEEHGDGGYQPHEDEHVWLSFQNAALLSSAIADALFDLDPDNIAVYRDNLAAYTEKLLALDVEYRAAVDAAAVKTLVFADRFPFRYMAEDYGLSYYSAFQGCSAETEAGFTTIISLANRVNRLGLDVIMVTENSDRSVAASVINNTEAKNQRVLAMDSMQSVTADVVRSGVTYLSIMESNLDVLKEALK